MSNLPVNMLRAKVAVRPSVSPLKWEHVAYLTVHASITIKPTARPKVEIMEVPQATVWVRPVEAPAMIPALVASTMVAAAMENQR